MTEKMARKPFTRSNAMKKQNIKLINKSQAKIVTYEEIYRQQPRDLVLICQGGVQLEYHSQVLLNISRTLTEVMENEKPFGNFFLPSDSKTYVTIEGIGASIVKSIMETIYTSKDLKCEENNKGEIRNCLESLGITDKFYTIIEEENDAEEAIVDVIGNLLDDFEVTSSGASSQTDLVEFLMDGLDDTFINDISSSFDGETSLLNMEALLSEEVDREAKFSSTMEEVGEEGKLKSSSDTTNYPQSYQNLEMRSCYVKLENIPNETLSHYFGILKRKQKQDQSENAIQVSPVKRKKKSSELSGQDKRVTVPTEANLEAPEDKTVQLEDSLSCSAAEVQVVEVKEICCSFCQEKFPTRSRALHHLTLSHFQKQVLQLYPFLRGECPLCISQGRAKPYVSKAKQNHLLHIGQTHGVVIQFLPEDLQVKLEEYRRSGKGRNKSFSKIKIKEEKFSFDDSSDSISSSAIFNSSDVFNSSASLNSSDVFSSIDSFPSANDSFQESFTKSLEVGSNRATAAPETIFHNEDANMSAPVLQVECSLCPRSGSVSFQVKSDILSHLSWLHLSNELLTLFPPSEDNNNCTFCDEEFSSREVYIKHIGIVHEKVLEVLPSDFCEKILAMPDSQIIPPEAQQEIGQQTGSQASLKDPDVSVDNSRKLDFKSILSQSSPEPQICDPKLVRGTGSQIKPAQSKSFLCRYCQENFSESKTYRLHLLAHREVLINKSKT